METVGDRLSIARLYEQGEWRGYSREHAIAASMEKAISFISSFIMEQARKEGTRTTDRLRIGREQTSTADRELGGQKETEITYKFTAPRTAPIRELPN